MVAKKSKIRGRVSKLLLTAPKEKVRLAIVCTAEERKMIKILASFEDKSVNDFVMECVRSKMTQCKRRHVPNKETAKALKESQEGKGLRAHDSLDAMFKFLGI